MGRNVEVGEVMWHNVDAFSAQVLTTVIDDFRNASKDGGWKDDSLGRAPNFHCTSLVSALCRGIFSGQ